MGLRVLILDDNANRSASLVKALRQNKLVDEVLAVGQSSAAQTLCAMEPADLGIFCTLVHGEDGIEIAKHMLETDQLKAVAFYSCSLERWPEEAHRQRVRGVALRALCFYESKPTDTALESLLQKAHHLQLAAQANLPIAYEQQWQLSPCTATFFVTANPGKAGLWQGQIENRYVERELRFCGWDELLLGLDDACDMLDYPQRFRTKRSFTKLGSQPRDTEAFSQQVYLKKEIFPDFSKHALSMIIRIAQRQQGSLQGTVNWVNANNTQVAFVSALQLLHLVKEAATVTEGTVEYDRSGLLY